MSSCNSTKQTVPFKIEDVTHFQKVCSCLLQLPHNASHELIIANNSGTLKMSDQKKGWKDICIHQDYNGDVSCPVITIGHQYLHMCGNECNPKCLLSVYFVTGINYDILDCICNVALKLAASILDYPFMVSLWNILIPTGCIQVEQKHSCFLDTQTVTSRKWHRGRNSQLNYTFMRSYTCFQKSWQAR